MTHDERIQIMRDALNRIGYPEHTVVYVARDLAETAYHHGAWENQNHPCSGVGYAHGPHGKCPGYGTDRT